MDGLESLTFLPAPSMPESPSISIHFRGVVLGTTGFAMQGREWLAALERAGFEPSLDAARLGNRDDPLSPEEIELLGRCSDRSREPGGVVVHHLLIPHFRPDPDAVANVLSTTFEGPILPPGWSRIAGRATSVLVPTEWSMRVLAAGGVPGNRLFAMAPPLDAAVYDPRRFPPRFADRFRGRRWLVHYEDHHRRGHELFLQALGVTFRGDEAELRILPDPTCRRSPGQIEQDSLHTLARYQCGQMIKVSAYAPPATVDEQVRRYADADAFVKPTRGEGWDRALQEAMLMGLPVLASPSSAVGGFQLDETTGYPVQSHLSPLEPNTPEEERVLRGRYIYEPTFDSLCQRLRQVHRDPDEAASRGRAARATAMRDADPEHISRWLRELVEYAASGAA